MESRCYCGTVKATIKTEQHRTIHCHCNMCRQHSGADYTTWVAIDHSQVDLPQLTENIRQAQLGQYASVFFCSSCGTTVYALDSRQPNVVAFRAGTLKDFTVSPASADYFFSHKAEWYNEETCRKQYGGEDGFTILKNL